MLDIENLTIDYHSRGGPSRAAIENLNLHIADGETVGLLGESGCGKTTLALAILGVLPRTARVRSGSIKFGEKEMLGAPEAALRRIRGAHASIVFQEPALSLNPVMRVSAQVAEVVRAHTRESARRCRQRAESMLARVKLDGKRIYSAYPCELSAGQRQRVAIAQALVCNPRFLIADEPTSALDNTTQAEILTLLRELKERLRLAVLFITHNPAVLTGLADRVLIMYAGRIVEEGPLAQVLRSPQHHYTQTLLASLPPVPGEQLFKSDRRSPALTDAPKRTMPDNESSPLVEVKHLSKTYVQRQWFSRTKLRVEALHDVSLTVDSRSTLALVGESGAGKSTLGRCLSRLETADSGEVRFEGKNLLALSRKDLVAARRRIQLVFQDAAMAMNPRFSALEIVEEPLRIQTALDKRARREEALSVMEQVGIPRMWAQRSPLEFSGGQRQRLAIARALVLRPSFLIFDEALSGLDLSTQAEITRLLLHLQASHSLTFLYITHDLRSAGHIAQKIAVMRRDEVVESATVLELFSRPEHPYSKLLVHTIPRIETESPALA